MNKKMFIRLFGIICIAIGFWMLSGLLTAFGEMLSHANSTREISGVMIMPLVGILLVVFGVIAAWKPDSLKE